MLVMNESDEYFVYCYGGEEKFVPPKSGGTWEKGKTEDGISVIYEKVADDPPPTGVYVTGPEWIYLNQGNMRNRHKLKPVANVMTEVTGKLAELQAEKLRLAKENEEFKARLALFSEPEQKKQSVKTRK